MSGGDRRQPTTQGGPPMTEHHALATVTGCRHCETEEVGCIGSHHGAACEHPTCTSCGTLLASHESTCPECGRREAG